MYLLDEKAASADKPLFMTLYFPSYDDSSHFMGFSLPQAQGKTLF